MPIYIVQYKEVYFLLLLLYNLKNTEQKITQDNIKLPSVKNNNIITNMSFSGQINSVINDSYPKGNMFVVSSTTPKILQELGLNNFPITMTQRHLNAIMNANENYKGANYHNLGADIVKQIPRAIEKPLNILQSDTDTNSIVVVTDLADNQKLPIIASIKINGNGIINDIEIMSNVMTSAYGKNNYDAFMRKNIEKGNLLYDIDEGIIKRTDGKLQLRPTSSSTKNDTTNEQKSQIALPSTNSNMQINENK